MSRWPRSSNLAVLLGVWLAGLSVLGADDAIEDVSCGADIRLRFLHLWQWPADNPADREMAFRGRMRVKGNVAYESGLRLMLTLQSDAIREDVRTPDRTRHDVARAGIALESMAMLPIVCVLGRQRVHLDDGLLIASDQEIWSLDGASITFDFFPRTISLLAGRPSPFSPDNDIDALYWLHLHNDHEQPWLDHTVLYGGYVPRDDSAQPLIAGGRVKGYISPRLAVISELAYEFGDTASNSVFSAWIVDLSAAYKTHPNKASGLHARWLWASGDQDAGESRDFQTFMDDAVQGAVLNPRLNNVHIVNAGGRLEHDAWTILLQTYYYRQDNARATEVGSPRREHPGLATAPNGHDTELGLAADLTCSYAWSTSADLTLTVGAFWPGKAYDAILDERIDLVMATLAVRF